ncbi:hypothetical protein AOLI_G00217150 [Acnodon oligacanthus]
MALREGLLRILVDALGSSSSQARAKCEGRLTRRFSQQCEPAVEETHGLLSSAHPARGPPDAHGTRRRVVKRLEKTTADQKETAKERVMMMMMMMMMMNGYTSLFVRARVNAACAPQRGVQTSAGELNTFS